MTFGTTKNTMFSSLVMLLVCLFFSACNAQDTPSQDRQNNSVVSGSHTLAMTVNGSERTYIVHVPTTYKPQSSSAVVIMLHGGGGTARAALWETGWAVKSEKEGFLVVSPNAMARDPSQPGSFARNPQLWNDGSGRFYLGQRAPDDVGFIGAMLDDLSTRFSVDERRVFVTGFSNGASMSFRIGAELSKRIAAIAPVAGALWIEPLTLERPVPMVYITGTADPLNLIEGGVPRLATGGSDKIRAKAKPPVRDSILKWSKALGCAAAPRIASEANGVRTETYGPGRDGAEVVYITVEELGHTWAGGKSLLPEFMVGKRSDKINATDVIWEFFEKHPKG